MYSGPALQIKRSKTKKKLMWFLKLLFFNKIYLYKINFVETKI